MWDRWSDAGRHTYDEVILGPISHLHSPGLSRHFLCTPSGSLTMPKPNKSSASSGTRKKHAKRKDGPLNDEPNQKPKKEKGKKGSKLEPRPKVFIAPVKPAPVRPDPLETSGLAHTLSAELLVVLRNLSKKAIATKSRALLELQSGWIDKVMEIRKAVSGEEDEELVYFLVQMLPVWVRGYSTFYFCQLMQSY